jgi:CBS domain-containing protein
MKARDVITVNVISVGPDLGIHELARLLPDKGISGVPVVDTGGKPIGREHYRLSSCLQPDGQWRLI